MTVYRLLGLSVPITRMYPLAAAAHFSNVLAPSVGNIAMYIDDTRQHKLEAMLVWLARSINRVVYLFMKRDYLSEKIAHRFAKDTAEAFQRLRNGMQSLWLPFALALSAKTLHIIILMLIFLAFQRPFSLGTLIAGYSIANLFTIISVTPGAWRLLRVLWW